MKPLQNVVEVLPMRVNLMLGTCSGLELPVFKLLFSSVCHPPLSVSWQRASTARLPPSSSVSLRADNLQRASPDLRERKGYEHQPVPVFGGAGHGRRMARVFKNDFFFIFIDLHLCNQIGSSWCPLTSSSWSRSSGTFVPGVVFICCLARWGN